MGQVVGSRECPPAPVAPAPPQPPPGQPPRKENVSKDRVSIKERETNLQVLSQVRHPTSHRLVMDVLEKSTIRSRNKKGRDMGRVGCWRPSPTQDSGP